MRPASTSVEASDGTPITSSVVETRAAGQARTHAGAEHRRDDGHTEPQGGPTGAVLHRLDRLDCDRRVAGELLRAGDDHQTGEATQAARERTPAEQPQREQADRGERPGHRALQRAVDRRSRPGRGSAPGEPADEQGDDRQQGARDARRDARAGTVDAQPDPAERDRAGRWWSSQAYHHETCLDVCPESATGAPAAGRGPLGVPPGRTASELDARTRLGPQPVGHRVPRRPSPTISRHACDAVRARGRWTVSPPQGISAARFTSSVVTSSGTKSATTRTPDEPAARQPARSPRRPARGWMDVPSPRAPTVGDGDRRGDPEGILPPTGAAGPTAGHGSSPNSRGS